MHSYRRGFWFFVTAVAAALAAAHAHASDLVEVVPVSGRIVMLHFDDGSVSYHTRGQALTSDTVNVVPLTTSALSSDVFTITSPTHGAFKTGAKPVRMGRKSKGTEYAHNHTNWMDGFGFRPTTPYAALEHWIYLELPEALESGHNYAITWDQETLNTTTGSAILAFDENVTRSEAVHVNILGYAPGAPQKYGYLYHWAGDLGGVDLAAWTGREFRVVRVADGRVVHTGNVTFRRDASNAETAQARDTPSSNFLGAAVWECDFSSLTAPGDYRLAVSGLGCSYDFSIDRDVYREAFHAVMRGLFQNRSGITLAPPHADELRPAPHNPRPVADGGTPGFQNRLKYTTTRFCDIVSDGGGPADKAAVEAGARGNLTATWGWYQDAGDWDAYISHQDIPLGLLLMYQLYPEKFTDGELNLPESGNGIPDIVDEGAWLPRFFRRQRAELLEKGWGTGGVGSRVFGDYWGGDRPNDIGRGSWEDTDRDWYVTGEDPFSTYRYAASAAQLAEILAGLGAADPEGVDWTAEAREAYSWAGAHIRAGDDAKAPYGTLRGNRALAAVALYRLTGEAEYHAQAQSDLAGVGATEAGLSGAQLNAVVLYLAMPAARPADALLKARLTGALRASALHVTTASADRRACRWGGDYSMPMLVGQSSTPLIQAGVLGHRILRDHDAAAAADVLRVCYTTADYFLGGNPLHSTWITGLGERHPTGIFCMDDFYAGPAPRRGLIPYGAWRFPDAWITQRMAFSIWWMWDTTYPSLDPRGLFQPASGAGAPGTWPGHEAWFDNRNSPQTGEFTIHQNHLPAAMAYGFLCAEATTPPSIVSGPVGMTVEEGRPVTLRVVATDSGAITYQWRHDGRPVIDATTDTLTLPAAQTYQAGNYDVLVTGLRGSAISDSATIHVTPAAAGGTVRAVNISTRALCGRGDGILIPGFIIEGSGTRTLLVRAVGPRLGDFGVAGVLADPIMELTRTSTPAGVVAVSDNWNESSDVTQIESTSAAVGAFSLDGRSSGGILDRWSSAAVVDLAAGSYTPVCRGADGGTGVALVEIYDAGGTGDARVVNLSNRGFVSVGDEVMIPGLVARGGGTFSYLVRAAGPALGGFGVSGYLANPCIRVVSNATGATVASNDNWSDQTDQGDALLAIFSQVGAFPFVRDSRDAALKVTVPEGLYTLVCRGFGDTTGVALVEVYEVD